MMTAFWLILGATWLITFFNGVEGCSVADADAEDWGVGPRLVMGTLFTALRAACYLAILCAARLVIQGAG